MSKPVRTCCSCHREMAQLFASELAALKLSPVLTYQEAAHALRVHPRTVRNLCDQGDLQRTTLGGGSQLHRVTRASLDALIARHLVG